MTMLNKEKDATLQFVLNQINSGFNPKFMITYHYRHPTEHGWRVIENVSTFNSKWGFKSKKSLWNEVPSYNYYEKRRACEDSTIKDASQVKNVILKYFWGIKRPNQTWKYKYPPMLFFHEMGRTKLQYHTHLLLPELPDRFNSKDILEDEWNGYVKRSRKCFSRWKKVHVKEITNPYLIANYLVKEVSVHRHSLDYQNSLFINEV
jgi:hypothetical protein